MHPYSMGKLQLQLRKESKQTNLPKLTVNSIPAADKNPDRITKWIDDVKDLHKGQKTASVNYSKNMPEIETLMEEWDPEVGFRGGAASSTPS